MAVMCSLKGCQVKRGMCSHEKIMLALVVLGITAFVIAKALVLV